MTALPRHTRRGCAAALAAALIAAVAVVGSPAPSPASAAGCVAVGAIPARASTAALASGTACLVNLERARRGLRPLRYNPRLARAGARHARDMVRRSYFSHRSANGRSLTRRVRRAGYMRSARRWAVGENLGWGSGLMATPATIVRGWMNSPSHRANVLSRRFREIGVGVAPGAPLRGQLAAATYVANFGARR